MRVEKKTEKKKSLIWTFSTRSAMASTPQATAAAAKRLDEWETHAQLDDVQRTAVAELQVRTSTERRTNPLQRPCVVTCPCLVC